MAKRLDHVEAAKAEAERFGASIEFQHCRKHIVGIISINGQQRKVFISTTAKDGRILHNVREDVRKKVKEMQDN